MARKVRNPWWALAVVLVAGSVLGHMIAQAVIGYPALGFLAKELRLALPDPPVNIDLRVVSVTFGVLIRLNLAIVLGVIVAVWIYRLL